MAMPRDFPGFSKMTADFLRDFAKNSTFDSHGGESPRTTRSTFERLSLFRTCVGISPKRISTGVSRQKRKKIGIFGGTQRICVTLIRQQIRRATQPKVNTEARRPMLSMRIQLISGRAA